METRTKITQNSVILALPCEDFVGPRTDKILVSAMSLVRVIVASCSSPAASFLICAAGLAAAAPFSRLLRAAEVRPIPVLARHRFGLPHAGGRRAVDTARARAARGRRHAASRGRSGMGDRGRRSLPEDRAPRHGNRHAAMGALSARRSRRAGAGAQLFLPLPRRRGHEPDRPNPHRTRLRRRSGAAALRFRLLPAVRAGLLHRLPPHGGRRISTWSSTWATTSTNPPGGATTCASTMPASRSRSRSTATATPSTRATPTCRQRTRHSPGSSTWDDHEVQNDYANDRSQYPRSRATNSCDAAPQPTRPTTSTCRCRRACSRAAPMQ